MVQNYSQLIYAESFTDSVGLLYETQNIEWGEVWHISLEYWVNSCNYEYVSPQKSIVTSLPKEPAPSHLSEMSLLLLEDYNKAINFWQKDAVSPRDPSSPN